jgi:hypothetical protein
MGIIHASTKKKQKRELTVYDMITDGLSFRFCRIDNNCNCNWCGSRLLEWQDEDAISIFSIFKSLMRIAALSVLVYVSGPELATESEDTDILGKMTSI